MNTYTIAIAHLVIERHDRAYYMAILKYDGALTIIRIGRN
jgi:hypothetical protein